MQIILSHDTEIVFLQHHHTVSDYDLLLRKTDHRSSVVVTFNSVRFVPYNPPKGFNVDHGQYIED